MYPSMVLFVLKETIQTRADHQVHISCTLTLQQSWPIMMGHTPHFINESHGQQRSSNFTISQINNLHKDNQTYGFSHLKDNQQATKP